MYASRAILSALLTLAVPTLSQKQPDGTYTMTSSCTVSVAETNYFLVFDCPAFAATNPVFADPIETTVDRCFANIDGQLVAAQDGEASWTCPACSIEQNEILACNCNNAQKQTVDTTADLSDIYTFTISNGGSEVDFFCDDWSASD